MAKTTVTLDNEIVQSLLQGDLTCLQSVVKDLIEHALETKKEATHLVALKLDRLFR